MLGKRVHIHLRTTLLRSQCIRFRWLVGLLHLDVERWGNPLVEVLLMGCYDREIFRFSWYAVVEGFLRWTLKAMHLCSGERIRLRSNKYVTSGLGPHKGLGVVMNQLVRFGIYYQ